MRVTVYEPITYEFTVSPTLSSLSLSATTFQGTPQNNEVGTYTVTLSASDSSGTESKSFGLTIARNDPP